MVSLSNVLLAFYGDDFTGSTDAMEALSTHGYRTILFLQPPTPDQLTQFSEIACIGVAGTSRAKSPKGMSEELYPIMDKLSKYETPVVHYKTCSTFDSSPEIGSIGQAIKTSRNHFNNQQVIPLLVGAPKLGRYTVFGNHFARMNDEIYRLDRHPVMSKHPITPMNESDLRLHLKKQLNEEVALIDILDLEKDYSDLLKLFKEKTKDNSVILLDAIDEERLKKSGHLIWDNALEGNRLVVGSSGVEYALTAYWNSIGSPMKREFSPKYRVKASENILVVSGSASAITKVQIEQAISEGFKGIKIPLEVLTGSETDISNFIKEPIKLLGQGEDVILYSALGPDDPSIKNVRQQITKNGIASAFSGEFLGKKLGQCTLAIMKETKIRRVVIAGGDTSSFVTSEMGIYGLEMLMPLSPGAPLCTVYSEEEEMNGVELALKGGQLGGRNYFMDVKNATSN